MGLEEWEVFGFRLEYWGVYDKKGGNWKRGSV